MEKDTIECNCIIERLIIERFYSLSHEEKENVMKCVVPQPDINVIQEDENQAPQKRFDMHMYTKFNWLCGCLRLKKLFCWPCLLLSTSTTKWTTLGFDDLTNIAKCTKFHHSSSVHKHSQEKLDHFLALIKNPAQFDKSAKRAKITKSMSTCNCIIEEVLRTNFPKMSYTNKIEIISSEIPKPNFQVAQQAENELQQFNMYFYTLASWLCGCEYLMKLFCWPCLLFCPMHTIWSFYGYKSLANIHKLIKVHQSSKKHIDAEEALAKLKSSHLEAIASVPEVESNTCNCIIETLVIKTFLSMKLSRKKAIVNGGIPQPKFDIIANKKNICVEKLYSKTPWLCGCAHLSKLFCWPCLLFCDTLNSWSKFGFTKIATFDELSKIHQKTSQHMKSKTKLKFLQRDIDKSNSDDQHSSSEDLDNVLNIDSVAPKSFEQVYQCDVTFNDLDIKKDTEDGDIELWVNQETEDPLNTKINIRQEENNANYSEIQSNFNNESNYSESEIFEQYNINQEWTDDDVDIEMEFDEFVEKKVDLNSEMVEDVPMDVASLPLDTFSSNPIVNFKVEEIDTEISNTSIEKIEEQKQPENITMIKTELINTDTLSEPMDVECLEPQTKLGSSIEERPNSIDSTNTKVLHKNSPVIKIVLERTDLKKHMGTQNQIPSKMIQDFPILEERLRASDKEQVENLTIAKILKKYNEKKHQKQSPADSCDCVIETLTRYGNTRLFEEDTRALVAADVPRPYLDIIQKHKTATYVRHFHLHIYSDFKWLCGCKRDQKLFCWPCLIFSSVKNCWNTSGHDNLGNLKKACLRHELTKPHLGAQILFKRCQDRIANVDIEKTPNSCDEGDNKIISGNRYIISKMIDAICFLSNRGQIKMNLIDLLFFMSESDGKLKHFLQSLKMKKKFLNSIQDNLTNAIAKVVLEEIKHEIRESTFVSIVVAESKRHRSYLSLHMRYLNKNNHVQERLVGFKNVDLSSNLLKYIEDKVIDLGCGGKIIAQAHDGASLTDEIHKNVQITFPLATLTHHHSFKLNFLLSQAIRGLDGFAHFFQKIKMISSFFCKSTKRTASLNSKIRSRIPDFDQINLQYNNTIFSVIDKYKLDMLKVFEDVLANGEEWDADTTLYASGLQRLLKDLQFNFNMKLFANVYNGTLRLSNHLQNNPFDITGCKKEINTFLLHLNAMKLQFDSIWICLIMEGYETEEEAQKWNLNKTELKLFFKEKYNKTVDKLINVINVRFSELNKIAFVALLDVKLMLQKSTHTFEDLIHCLNSVYPDLFNMNKLKCELEYLYTCENCRDLNSVVDVFNALIDIKDILSEVWKLVKLVYALPIMYPIAKDHPRFEFEGKNSSLAILSSEKSLLENLKKSQVLYNRAIEEFSKNEQRIKLLFG